MDKSQEDNISNLITNTKNIIFSLSNNDKSINQYLKTEANIDSKFSNVINSENLYEAITQLQNALIKSNQNTSQLKNTLDELLQNNYDQSLIIKEQNEKIQCWEYQSKQQEQIISQLNSKVEQLKQEKYDLQVKTKDLQIKLKEELESLLTYKRNIVELSKSNEMLLLKNNKIEDDYNKYTLQYKQALKDILSFSLISLDNGGVDDIINKQTNIFEIFKKTMIEQNSNSNEISIIKDKLLKISNVNQILERKFQEELYFRRKIHHTYLLLRGNLRVMCRIRPYIKDEISKNNEIKMQESFTSSFGVFNDHINTYQNNKKFPFDYVFNQTSSQRELSEETKFLVNSLMDEKNISVISYGQTGTGKTYTTIGTKENPGLVHNSLYELFKISSIINTENKNDNSILFTESDTYSYINKEKLNQFTDIKISMCALEIYNDNIYNLLEDNNSPLLIYEDSNSLNIPDLKYININCFDEAIKLIRIANKFKKIKETSYNITSSRSHTIFTFIVNFKLNFDKEFTSKLNIIDLAGSERITKFNIKDEKLKNESIFINLSLSSLSNVLNAIKSKQKHIPYRDCKLTHLLKESLSCNFIILMILHISPNVKDYCETLGTLNFSKMITRYGNNIN